MLYDKKKMSSLIMELLENNILHRENLTILMTELANQDFYKQMNEDQQEKFIHFQDALIKFIAFNSVVTTLDLFEKLPNKDLKADN